jgi:hypothetical protein
MPTGRLIAADGRQVSGGHRPFTVVLPSGSHPVTVAIATYADRSDRRVAGCRVLVREEPVAYWEPALRPGEDASTLGDGEYFVVGVDSGTIAFIDAAWRGDPREDLPDDFWQKGYTVLEPPDPATNMVVFASGYGDGGYPVWIGRSSDGDLVCVVADTEVLTGSTLIGPAEPDAAR